MRVLLVSYAFPPVGGVGVQRVLKLAKYLPQCGVQPSVLTARGASVPVLDRALERELPPGVEVLRAPTLEPDYSAKELAWKASGNRASSLKTRLVAAATSVARRLLVPDPQVLWLPAAGFTLARRLASRRADDVVFITGPPFSPFLLAALARLRPGTAVVLDYRDEWTTTNTYEMSASPRAANLLEHRLVSKAHVLTTATDDFRSALLARFPNLREDRVVTIPNGYDPDDFPSDLPSPPSDRFVLSYVGTVYRLTSASGLLAGLALFHTRAPELARSLETRFVGRIVATEEPYFEGSEALGVRRMGYVEHHRAIEELAASHASLCLLPDLEGNARIYPGKIFEIMYLGRPCLALAPEGALTRLVRSCRAGEVVHPDDAPGIAETLERWVRRFRNDPHARPEGPVDIERFNRREQARTFAATFRTALAAARHRLSA